VGFIGNGCPIVEGMDDVGVFQMFKHSPSHSSSNVTHCDLSDLSSILGYYWLFYHALLLVILLYAIVGYSKLFYHWLFLGILDFFGDYSWSFYVIISKIKISIILNYFIKNYFRLLLVILL